MHIRTFIFVFAALSMMACDDPDAPEKCRAIGTAFCEKSVEYCDPMFSPPQDECEDIFNEAVVCDDAVYVELEYDECLTDVDELEECPIATPSSCDGVVALSPQEDEVEDDDEDDDE